MFDKIKFLFTKHEELKSERLQNFYIDDPSKDYQFKIKIKCYRTESESIVNLVGASTHHYVNFKCPHCSQDFNEALVDYAYGSDVYMKMNHKLESVEQIEIITNQLYQSTFEDF